MIDLKVIVPKKIRKFKVGPLGYRYDEMYRDAPLDLTDDINRLIQLIAIKIINRGYQVLSATDADQFPAMARHIVSVVRDNIRDEQSAADLEGYALTDSERLVDLQLSEFNSNSKSIKVDVTTVNQALSFSLAFEYPY